MITSTIGRTFLKAYNTKSGTNWSAKEFFEKEYWPLFYDSPKYMQWITNSPFVQGLSSDPNGVYGIREKLKIENGKTMLFPSDNEAVKYFKNNIDKRTDLLYCQLPKYNLTKKAVEYLSTLELTDIEDYKNIIKSINFNINIFFKRNDEDKWVFSNLGIQEILKQKFHCYDDALIFFTEKFIKTKGFFIQKDTNKVSKRGIEIIKTLNKIERKKMLDDFNKKAQDAANNNEFDGSIAIGFPASEIERTATHIKSKFQVASGQVTDIDIHYNEEDIYASWIGNGLGIGVDGGYTIFFDNQYILYSLFEGWKIYRELLEDMAINHQGKQVDTWNGQWLACRYDKYYNNENDYASLQNFISFNSNDDGSISISTISWSRIIFKISNSINQKEILGFIGNFAKTNKTLGFYPFYFSEAKTFIKYYRILFGEQAAISDAKDYESLYGMNIKRACELGSFGLQALEPQSLRKYFCNDANLKLVKPSIKQKGGETEADYNARKSKVLQNDHYNIITYRTYKTWLTAMITKNKEESLEYTSEVAKSLLVYRAKATKNDRKNLIDSDILGAKSKKAFIDALALIIKDIDKESLESFKQLRDRVHLMSAEDFGYFVVLLKFDYAYAERNS